MPNMLISILMPCKNTARFLPECLDSICNQTFKNWELLVVDDGSTDDSFEIINGYAIKDSRIKLLKNNGSGIIEALRLAYTKSSGNLITRMDSDDIMSLNKLEILSENLTKTGKGSVAVGLVKYFSEKGINEGYSNYEKWLNDLTIKGLNFSEIYKECVIPSPCWMIHREDLDACQAFKPDRYPEDYDLTFRYYEKNFRCIPCDKTLHHWRDYETRTSRTHEHYALNHFLEIKLHYFLKLDYDATRPLVIWGAGLKGKTSAKILMDHAIPFFWICDNPKKIGKYIYNQKLLNFKFLENIKNPQSIITVANAEAQIEIKSYLKTKNMAAMTDYFFFC